MIEKNAKITLRIIAPVWSIFLIEQIIERNIAIGIPVKITLSTLFLILFAENESGENDLNKVKSRLRQINVIERQKRILIRVFIDEEPF